MARRRQGRFLGVPYDWRRPTARRARERWWNPDEPRLFVPKTYGWGWALNFGVLRRLTRRR